MNLATLGTVIGALPASITASGDLHPTLNPSTGQWTLTVQVPTGSQTAAAVNTFATNHAVTAYVTTVDLV